MASVAENLAGIRTREQRPFREVSNGYTYFEENDVLFAKITPCLQNGKHALATGLTAGIGFGTTEFHVIRPGDGIDPRHLFRVVTQQPNIDKCTKSFAGTAGQQRVQPDTLKSLNFLLPPLAEQRAIAAVLDSIDEAIERTEEVIAATETLRDSLLHELLTRGIPGWHTEWKEVPGLGTIAADWEVVRLEDVAEVRGGSTPSRTEPSFWDGEIPWVVPSELTALKGRYLATTNERITQQGMASAGLSLLPVGSILLTSRATIGVAAINAIPVVTNQGFQNLVVKGGIDSIWLYYCVRFRGPELERRAAGSTFREVSRQGVRSLPILLPPPAEQRAVANALECGRGLDALMELKVAASSALISGSFLGPEG